MLLHPQWITGFVDGEGCFSIEINRNETITVGYQVQPSFVVSQNAISVNVLHGLKDYFKTGVVRSGGHEGRLQYRVRDSKQLRQTIIPFFEQNKLKTRKAVDFIKFRKVLLLMERNEHLTHPGLEKIRFIKNSMNTNDFVRTNKKFKIESDLK